MAAARRRYWDSNAFLAWLAEEAGRVDRCRGTIRAAEKGDLVIVTSSLTLTEVVKLKSKTALSPEKEPIIRNFFLHDYIVVRQLDRRTAEHARQLVWREGVDPKDAVHVATALAARVEQLDTFDGELIKKSGQVGNPSLRIGWPDVPEQLEIAEGTSDG